MINREIPFRPRLEGEFRVRFYNAASEITEKTPTLTIARIAEREIEWVEKYSLQGTTQGRYLTGGVPPIRFSM